MIPEREPGALARYLAKELGVPYRIASAHRMSMGQSRAMYVVGLESDEAPAREVVVRVEQWGLLGTDSHDEVRVMQVLHAAGHPVAEVLCYERTPDVLGQPFFVMEYVPGTSVFTRESLDPYVRELDRLHRLDREAVGLDFLPAPQGPRGGALLQIERWYEVYRRALTGEPSPLVEEAAQWLRNHAPISERTSLVHGDTGPGNYLHRDGRLTALVDWEFAHLGDPEEDWAYLMCMRGIGVMTEAAWLDYLRSEVGVEIEPERLRFWKAFNFFKGACIDQTALGIFAAGRSLAPNLLAIGTAVHLSALKRLAAMVR